MPIGENNNIPAPIGALKDESSALQELDGSKINFADKENEMNSEDKSEATGATETGKSPTDVSSPREALLAALPSSYEIEYRTRVRFPAPEILAAAAEIGEKVAALEADLANIKQLVAVIQEKIARGFDVTESSSAIYSSGEKATGLEILGAKKATEALEEEEEPEDLDDAFMTLL
ncbi:MAG: hypothetical protein ACFFGZ_04350 [Candidatus Thorarchaeota archaeon]